ncbi:hypothetical protein M407DRAFT_246712, partial [Tulasnella calospora MUT 4182]
MPCGWRTNVRGHCGTSYPFLIFYVYSLAHYTTVIYRLELFREPNFGVSVYGSLFQAVAVCSHERPIEFELTIKLQARASVYADYV